MKFHLSLYGHKMPVTYYDISSDGALIVSGGLDKSIKIWGMDFGDCHKTLPAHSDIVTCVKFIQDTHFFISCSKDCTMKYYDADTFEFISLLTNDLLCNQFLCLDINNEGTQIISSCNDNSIKIFNISQEQVVPKLTQQELLEKNMIKEQEKEFNNNKTVSNNTFGEKEENVTGQVIKKMDHLTYAENLIEKLNLCEKFKESVIQYQMEVDEYIKNTKIISEDENKIKDVKIYNLNIQMEKPRPNILFFGKNIFEVIINEIKKIPYFDLENVLNNISYAYFQKLVYYFEHYIRKNIEIELIGRCIIFFCTLYESQISNDKVILNNLRSIYMRLQGRFKLKYSLIKFNQKSIELIIKKFEDFQKNKKSMEEYNNNNIIDLKE
jgi:U3 small nucleolar RNA-associated protein 12